MANLTSQTRFPIAIGNIEKMIFLIRGQKVILDTDLAGLYGVGTKTLNRAVNRNKERFPADFMFQLSKQEFVSLRYQIGTSNGRGGRRYPPYAFTEQGVAMLSSVLKSQQAILVNISIMRAFVRLRELASAHKELAEKLSELEKKYDKRFLIVFEAIRQLMLPLRQPGKPRKIGFITKDDG